MQLRNPGIGLLAGLALAAGTPALADDGHFNERSGIRHVLLISIDGMHAVDFLNCSRGVATVNSGAPYCPNLKWLKDHGGINYLDTSASKPSDSFPGLMSIVTGGTPRTMGVYYDVAYDRALAPPASTTGNGLSAGSCTPGVFNGTTTEYEEGIDINQNFLNGTGSPGTDGGIASIDATRLPRDPAHGCAPVYPWNFIRVNTVFGVIHDAGGYTAWEDKHPAYASVSGPTRHHAPSVAENLDDFYGPEINSVPVALPGCSAADDPNFASLGSYTDSFACVRSYDTLKVNGVLNQIDGFTHSRAARAPVPQIFGMNFQAVSVGQKLIEKNVGSGGYSDAIGTPTALMLAQIQFVDAAIGKFTSELYRNGLGDSTLVIITAKHGQSPVDTARYTGITAAGPVTTSPSLIIDSCLPDSESNAGNQIGPTEDDVSLLWLKSGCDAGTEAALIESTSPASNNVAGIGQIFYGRAIAQMFNAPGLPPLDSRTPDIVVTPNVGVTYSGSRKKHAEHGGFAHDDVNVVLLVSNPHLSGKTITSVVETSQVGPTILEALGLSPAKLDAVRLQGTQSLPGLPFHVDGDR
ncbi:MAG: alkaline phosphatase family protein [Steroidobacteraceae bacterium]